MTDFKTNVYQERVSSGAYTRLIDNIMAMKSRALVSSEYKRDFYQDSKKNFVTPRKEKGTPPHLRRGCLEKLHPAPPVLSTRHREITI